MPALGEEREGGGDDDDDDGPGPSCCGCVRFKVSLPAVLVLTTGPGGPALVPGFVERLDLEEEEEEEEGWGCDGGIAATAAVGSFTSTVLHG